MPPLKSTLLATGNQGIGYAAGEVHSNMKPLGIHLALIRGEEGDHQVAQLPLVTAASVALSEFCEADERFAAGRSGPLQC